MRRLSARRPELGEETVPPDEMRDIETLLALERTVQEQDDRSKRPVPRNVHPKQHGCVRAELIIESGLASELRHGLFREARTFPAVIRFSNAKQRNDQLPDGHGIAIKLFGVGGEKLLEAERNATTHDFILIDHPVFFAKNVADMVPLMRDFRRLLLGNPATKAFVGLKALLSRDYRFRLIRQAGDKRPDNPLSIQYWSTTPYRLDAGAVKFSLRPLLDRLPVRPVASPDKLRMAMSAHLRERDAFFDFMVQRQIDSIAMPIEDASAQWDETASPFKKVATLRIPRQEFEAPTQFGFGEDLSFTPWHAIADHRPLGGINRARKYIYEAMSRRRHELNGVVKAEPTFEDAAAIFRGM